MPPKSRKPPRKTKGRAPIIYKTDRIELTPFQRGLIVHACLFYNQSQNSVAKTFGCSQASVAKLLQRIKQRQKESQVAWDDIGLYGTERGRGRKQKDQKEEENVVDELGENRGGEGGEWNGDGLNDSAMRALLSGGDQSTYMGVGEAMPDMGFINAGDEEQIQGLASERSIVAFA